MMLFIGLTLFTAIWVGFAKWLYGRAVTPLEAAMQFTVTAIVIAITISIGLYRSSSDTELWHGEVVSKERAQNYYQTSYDCNCRCTSSDKSGNCTTTSCDTCYTDHYTVKWSLETTLGGYWIDSIDHTTRAAWATPDPQEYLQAYQGQPFATSHTYTNYFILSKNSLFASNASPVTFQQPLLNANYPCVNGYYVNLVINDGVRGLDINLYNELIRDYLRVAGAGKQVNVILYFTTVQDQAYRYALEAKWLGGKKNDVIVIIGVDSTLKPTWVDALTMGKNAGNEMLEVALREDLIHANLADPKATVSTITKNINKLFKRKPMHDFKYLEAAQQTPNNVIVFALLLTIILNIGFTILNVKYWDIR